MQSFITRSCIMSPNTRDARTSENSRVTQISDQESDKNKRRSFRQISHSDGQHAKANQGNINPCPRSCLPRSLFSPPVSSFLRNIDPLIRASYWRHSPPWSHPESPSAVTARIRANPPQINKNGAGWEERLIVGHGRLKARWELIYSHEWACFPDGIWGASRIRSQMTISLGTQCTSFGLLLSAFTLRAEGWVIDTDTKR